MMRRLLLFLIASLFLASTVHAGGEIYGPASSSYPGVTSDGANGLNVAGAVAIGPTQQTSMDSSGVSTVKVRTQAGTAAAPGLIIGDSAGGAEGIYQVLNGFLSFSISGINRADFTENGMYMAQGGYFHNRTPTATQTSFSASNGDDNTGMGSAGADQLSLIAGGVEAMRLGKMGSGATAYVVGAFGIGGAPNETGISGLTSVQSFQSGISPAGTPTEGVMVYCTGNQWYVASALGDHTLLSGHDPKTGEPVHLSWNVYSGIGRKVLLKTGTVENFTVAKQNPETVLKADFVRKYQAEKATWQATTKSEALEQATETTYEVVQKRTLDAKSGDVISTTERVPYAEIPTSEWRVKTGCRINETSGAYEKLTTPSAAEAEGKFTMDWSRLSSEVRAAWGVAEAAK